MAQRVGRLHISHDHLIQALDLPVDTQIGTANYNFERGYLELVISQPDLPEQTELNIFAPVVIPKYVSGQFSGWKVIV